jgi:hypothetical protein
VYQTSENEVEGFVQEFMWNEYPLKIKSSRTRNSAPSRLLNIKETTFVDETENITHIAMHTGVPIVKRVSDTVERPTVSEHSMFTFRVPRNKNKGRLNG